LLSGCCLHEASSLLITTEEASLAIVQGADKMGSG